MASLSPLEGGVASADDQVAIGLHLGFVAELAAGAGRYGRGKDQAPGLQQGFVEGGVFNALGAVFFGHRVAGFASYLVPGGGIAKLLDLVEQFLAGELGHGEAVVLVGP